MNVILYRHLPCTWAKGYYYYWVSYVRNIVYVTCAMYSIIYLLSASWIYQHAWPFILWQGLKIYKIEEQDLLSSKKHLRLIISFWQNDLLIKWLWFVVIYFNFFAFEDRKFCVLFYPLRKYINYYGNSFIWRNRNFKDSYV